MRDVAGTGLAIVLGAFGVAMLLAVLVTSASEPMSMAALVFTIAVALVFLAIGYLLAVDNTRLAYAAKGK